MERDNNFYSPEGDGEEESELVRTLFDPQVSIETKRMAIRKLFASKEAAERHDASGAWIN